MSGVEAAASLFGSEDSDFRPIYDSGNRQCVDKSIRRIARCANEPSSETHLYSTSQLSPPTTRYTLSIMPNPPQNGGDGHDFYNHSQRHAVGQSRSTVGGGPQSRIPPIPVRYAHFSFSQITTHLAAAEPPTSTTDHSNSYVSHEYAPRATNTKQLPVAASTHSNNYTPRSYAPASTYAPYTPPLQPAPTSTNLPKSTTTTNMTYPPAPPALVHPQPPLPLPSTLTRPKLTNAYDPPFLPTKPSRRTGRLAADAYQTYNVHQSSGAPAPYASEIAVPDAIQELPSQGYTLA
jgi:hypothetical protein